MSFAPERVRTARQRAGLSLSQAAVQVGRYRTVLSRYELGEVTPSATVLASLAQAYGCAPADFFDSPTVGVR